MTKELSRTIKGKFLGGICEFTVHLKSQDFEQTGDMPLALRAKHDKKYNLRIKQEDLVLVDALADAKGVPRSVIFNHLLHEILRKELMNIQDLDVRLLLAETADQRSPGNKLSSSWAQDAIQAQSEAIFENIRKYNSAVLDYQDDPYAPADHSYNSKNYLAIKNKLNGIKNE